MSENDPNQQSEKPNDPTLLERWYRTYSKDGTIPTEEEFQERIRRGLEELDKRYHPTED